MMSALPQSVPDHPPGPPASVLPPLEALGSAFADAALAEDFAEDDLREAVCDYTRTCRAAGLPPERVIVAVKAAAAAVGLVHRGQDELNPELERVVRWCIEEYYRAG